MDRPSLIIFLCLAAFVVLSEGSHFQGGSISCGATTGYTARCEWKQGWRYQTGPCCYRCSYPASIGVYMSCSQGWWGCKSGCSNSKLATITYTVTGISTSENWEQGTHWFTYNFGGPGPFTIGYSSCCWRSLSYGYGGSWSVQVTFSLGSRTDTGKANTAPSTASTPIYRYQYGCGTSKTIIPMIDQDNDIVKCRWSVGNECAAVCNSLPNASLVSSGGNCELTMNTSGGSVSSGGWYAVAISLEDFPRQTMTSSGRTYSTSSVISIVPLQFMVYTPSMAVLCSAVPYWVSPTPAKGHLFSVQRGNTLTVTLMAIDQSGHRVNSLIVSGPSGVSQSSLQNSGNNRYVVVNWTPTSSHTGGYNLCFSANDGIGKVSEFRCVTVAVAIICPNPGFGTNTGRQPSNTPTFNFGDTVVYSCNNGYKFSSGNMLRTCQLNAAFDGSAPVCTIINCGAPAVGSGASKSSGSNYNWNGVTTFGCNTGHVASGGSSSRSCSGSGLWSGSAYTCTRRNCGNPGTPSNCNRGGSNYLYGDSLTFSCSTGYYVSNGGSTSRTCQSSGAWSGSQPACSRIQCSNPGTIRNSTRVLSPSSSTFLYLDTVAFNPHTGYEIKSGSQTRSCQSNAQWSGSAPTVGRITCPTLTRHNNATQTGGAARFLDHISWVCNTGYERASGDFHVQCQANRAWNGSVLQCKRITCPTLLPHNNATQTGYAYRYLDDISWACNTGYERDTGDFNVQCLSTRAWNGSVLTCKRITCPTLVPHNNATQTGFAYRYLDHISWVCHTGYERDTGDFNVQCLSTRAWNGTGLTCKRRTCPTLVPHNNATQTGSGFRYLDHVSWSCNTGYERDSNDFHVQCQANRAWNGSVLQCKRITCPTLLPHNNATQTGYAYRYLDHISWVCHTGYERDTGDFNVQCLSTRAWNGTVLTCKRITCPTLVPHNNATQTGFAYRYLDYVSWFCHTGYERDTGDFNVQCQPNRAWNGSVLTCKRRTCPTLVPHNNATQTGFGFRYLDHVSWSCNTGYERDSNDFHVQCQANRAWNGSVLQCKRITCPTLGPHNNATQTGFAYRYLDYVSWACHTGYERDTGDFNVQCQANRAWNGSVLTCKRITCPTLTPHNNVTQTGFAYRYLDYISWVFHIGYERDSGDFNVQCQATRAWNGTVLVAKRVTCPTPLYVSNSSQLASDFKYLGIINYQCNYGYEIKNGSAIRVCQAPLNTCNTYGASCPGWWNGTLPMCGRKECFNMTNPRNAHVVLNFYGPNINTRNYRFFYLDKITWKCDFGFARKAGDWVQECLGTAVWNGTSPTCKDIDECRSSPCHNNAICKNLVGRFQCLCVNGYSGATCTVPPTISPQLSGSAGSALNPFNNHQNTFQKSGAERGVAGRGVLTCLLLLLCGLHLSMWRN